MTELTAMKIETILLTIVTVNVRSYYDLPMSIAYETNKATPSPFPSPSPIRFSSVLHRIGGRIAFREPLHQPQ